MKNLNKIMIVGLMGNLMCLGLALSQKVSGNITSKTALTRRQIALVNIAKHVKSDSCFTDTSKLPRKVGDVISTKGTTTGRLDTGCVYSPSTKQFFAVAYGDNELEVQRIYSIKEVKNQMSIKDPE